MAKQKAVYAPGELAKTRERLGSLDKDEAKRMTQLLGGEIGYERTEDQQSSQQQRGGRRGRGDAGDSGLPSRKPGRRVELAGDEERISKEDVKEYLKKQKTRKRENLADDPSVTLIIPYWNRVKMDRYCGQVEFEIKSSAQVLVSVLSFFGDPADYVNPAFVNRRMNEYYKRIELLVASVRTLFPRNNLKRNEQMRKASPFAFAVLDTIRYWNIDHISAELSRIQVRPRSVKTTDLADILRDIYKPLYMLEQLELETHIKGAFTLLYKALYVEKPSDAKKYQDLIKTALYSLGVIRRDIRFQLYPLFMKLISHCWLPYEAFFKERRNRIAHFLGVTEKNRINPQMENSLTEDEAVEIAKEVEDEEITAEDETEKGEEETLSEEEQSEKQAQESEAKAVKKGLSALETLFPGSGWERIQFFPDLYPYFSDVFSFKKGAELIAPTDPLQQVFVLCRILEELFFGLRYVTFGTIIGPDGNAERLDDPMVKIINEWQGIVEKSFDKEYLTRLDEYCRMLENTAESRTSNYAKRLMNELHWAKRLYFLPYYRFESIMPPSFQKNTLTAVYPIVSTLRRYLAALAGAIEEGNRRGGAEKKAPCDGIDNPWEPYVFQVPNPVSKRLDALLGQKKRNNASLVTFTLLVTTVLDHLLNDEDSWAYSKKSDFIFRSENGDGIRPRFGVDAKVDTTLLFKQALKIRQLQAARAAAKETKTEDDELFSNSG